MGVWQFCLQGGVTPKTDVAPTYQAQRQLNGPSQKSELVGAFSNSIPLSGIVSVKMETSIIQLNVQNAFLEIKHTFFSYLLYSSIPPTEMSAAINLNKLVSSNSNSSGLRQQPSVDSERSSMMIPPCVRIEGCTPPSDSSLDADLDQCK